MSSFVKMQFSLFLLNGNFIVTLKFQRVSTRVFFTNMTVPWVGPCYHLIFHGKSMKIYQMKWKKWTLFATTHTDRSR